MPRRSGGVRCMPRRKAGPTQPSAALSGRGAPPTPGANCGGKQKIHLKRGQVFRDRDRFWLVSPTTKAKRKHRQSPADGPKQRRAPLVPVWCVDDSHSSARNLPDFRWFSYFALFAVHKSFSEDESPIEQPYTSLSNLPVDFNLSDLPAVRRFNL